MKNKLYFDDMELMQLEFWMEQTKDQMMMGGEIRRHASITQKIKKEMKDRTKKNKSYTTEGLLAQIEAEIERRTKSES